MPHMISCPFCGGSGNVTEREREEYEQREIDREVGAAIRRKLATLIPHLDPVHALRNDSNKVAFDCGDGLCTKVASTIADVLDPGSVLYPECNG